MPVVRLLDFIFSSFRLLMLTVGISIFRCWVISFRHSDLQLSQFVFPISSLAALPPISNHTPSTTHRHNLFYFDDPWITLGSLYQRISMDSKSVHVNTFIEHVNAFSQTGYPALAV